jgi:hypothetical protein
VAIDERGLRGLEKIASRMIDRGCIGAPHDAQKHVLKNIFEIRSWDAAAQIFAQEWNVGPEECDQIRGFGSLCGRRRLIGGRRCRGSSRRAMSEPLIIGRDAFNLKIWRIGAECHCASPG